MVTLSKRINFILHYITKESGIPYKQVFCDELKKKIRKKMPTPNSPTAAQVIAVFGEENMLGGPRETGRGCGFRPKASLTEAATVERPALASGC